MDGIGTIPLSEASEIVFYIDTYKGKLFANIRKFIKSHKYTGPTASGIKLTFEQITCLRNALGEISQDSQNVQERQIVTFPKGENQYIAACISLFNGQYGIDIRQYVSTEKYKGPTKKGVRIPFYRLQEILSYFDKMLAALEQEEKHTTLFGEHEKESQTKSTETKNEKVKGVPDEYQQLFE